MIDLIGSTIAVHGVAAVLVHRAIRRAARADAAAESDGPS